MFQTLGPLELVIILVIVIALFGAGRIAGVGRALGTSVREFRSEARSGSAGDDSDDDDETDADADTDDAVAEADDATEAPATAKKDAKA